MTKEQERLEKRRKHGQTIRELADEFGKSKSTVQRRLSDKAKAMKDEADDWDESHND